MSFLSVLAVVEAMPEVVRIRPELALVMTLLVVLVFDLLTKGRESWHVGTISMIGLAGTLYFLFLELDLMGLDRMDGGDARTVLGMIRVDYFALFFKILTAASVLIVMAMSLEFRGFKRDGLGEYYFILLCATLGAFVVVSTQNLLLLVLGLETLGISSYVLAGYLKKDRRSAEASLKYIVFGAVATGMLLYGISLLYGLTGTIDLTKIAGRLRDGGIAGETSLPILGISVLLILAGFAYKISAVPFHFWAPDVYEGSPTPVTTFLAVASKTAGFGGLIRVLMGIFYVSGPDGIVLRRLPYAAEVGLMIGVLAAVTMTYGNLAALRQTNLKRLLAYSSIAHAGYVLAGLAAFTADGFRSAAFYLVTYYFMNLAAFGGVIYFFNRTGREDIASLSRLGWRFPFVGAVIVIAMISLTGLPPTGGFVGKWMVLTAILEDSAVQPFLWLAVFIALNSVISLFYYFRIVRSLYFGMPGGEAEVRTTSSPGLATVLGFLAVGTVVLGVYFSPLVEKTYQARTEVVDADEPTEPMDIFESRAQRDFFFGVRLESGE